MAEYYPSRLWRPRLGLPATAGTAAANRSRATRAAAPPGKPDPARQFVVDGPGARSRARPGPGRGCGCLTAAVISACRRHPARIRTEPGKTSQHPQRSERRAAPAAGTAAARLTRALVWRAPARRDRGFRTVRPQPVREAWSTGAEVAGAPWQTRRPPPESSARPDTHCLGTSAPAKPAAIAAFFGRSPVRTPPAPEGCVAPRQSALALNTRRALRANVAPPPRRLRLVTLRTDGGQTYGLNGPAMDRWPSVVQLIPDKWRDPARQR